jgi:hypothetical protein
MEAENGMYLKKKRKKKVKGMVGRRMEYALHGMNALVTGFTYLKNRYGQWECKGSKFHILSKEKAAN